MKTIGLIGGMSWESTVEYYRVINQEVHSRLGGYHSAKCILSSVDFAEIETLQVAGDWESAGKALAIEAANLQRSGADLIVLCTNTMHIVAEEIQSAITVPFLHIADATARVIKQKGLGKIGLLGTRFTMQRDFYKGRLQSQHQLSIQVPDLPDQEIIHRVIYQELVHGIIRPESRQDYLRIINQMIQAGVEGVILGCTEIGMLVKAQDCSVPLFDTTRIHSQAAVDFALAN